MNADKQRIAIAEACGWKPSPHCPTFGAPPWGIPPAPKEAGRPWEEFPDYLNDLNAMHESEKVLTLAQKREYHTQLCEVQRAHHGKYKDGTYLISATAPQRAEAFLRTIGKWDPC